MRGRTAARPWCIEEKPPGAISKWQGGRPSAPPVLPVATVSPGPEVGPERVGHQPAAFWEEQRSETAESRGKPTGANMIGALGRGRSGGRIQKSGRRPLIHSQPGL